MSTGTTSAPAERAMAHTLVSPVDMFSATMAVTSWPVWVTPWATTPLSAHMTTTARLEMSTSALPVMPAMRMTASSAPPAAQGLGDGVPPGLRPLHGPPYRPGVIPATI